MHALVMPFAPRFLLYTIAIAGTVLLATLAFSQAGLNPPAWTTGFKPRTMNVSSHG
jgi:hypothetical protein